MEADCVAIRTPSRQNCCLGAPRLSSPGELLKLFFQRRMGDGSSIVGDGRGRDYRDDLQDLFLCEAGGEECIELLLAWVPALLNERPRQGGKCGKSLVARHKPRTDRVGLFRTHSLAESKGCVECYRILAGVRDCVGEEDDLNFLFVKAAAVYLLKHSSKGGQ